MSSSFRQFTASFLSFSLLLTGVCLAQTTERVSVSSQGVEGDGGSRMTSLSADGRFVAFASQASNLVPGDTNGVDDVFVYDRQTGVIERVSESSLGVEGDWFSAAPSISADGRYVSFSSVASNLVPGDSNGVTDIFVRDRQTGTTERVSISSQGGEGDSGCYSPSISADGRYVAFSSGATNLAPGDTNGNGDVFVHDRQTDTTVRVSDNLLGIEGNGNSYGPSISANGRFVAFVSYASNLVFGDWNWRADVFVHDRQTGVIERMSIDSSAIESNSHSYNPSISADGRYVAFGSSASNLVPGVTNGIDDIYVRDRQADVTERVSENLRGVEGQKWSSSPSISADGRYVAFYSWASNLVPGDRNGTHDIFVHDRLTGATERVSVSSQGVEGNSWSECPSISADGRYVAFESQATNFVLGDNNMWGDIFVHDRWSGLGANSIYLIGPATAPVGVPLNLDWATARPNSKYWLAYSKNTNGFNISGHSIDLGLFFTVMATGLNSGSGTGSFTTSPIPPRVAGSTLYFEVLARDTNGILYDSNALAIDFN